MVTVRRLFSRRGALAAVAVLVALAAAPAAWARHHDRWNVRIDGSGYSVNYGRGGHGYGYYTPTRPYVYDDYYRVRTWGAPYYVDDVGPVVYYRDGHRSRGYYRYAPSYHRYYGRPW